jgi:hypothetical protein
MGSSRLPFVVSLALCAVLASLPPAVVGQEGSDASPTQADFRNQVKRLAPNQSPMERLEALKWLNGQSGRKNAHLAVAALDRCIRMDSEADVRKAAVECLALIAQKRQEPCPLVIVEAMLDRDELVSQTADACAGLFRTYAPGCVAVLLQCASSENNDLRSQCLLHLARAGGKDRKALEAVEKAKHDRTFGIRHNAHCAMFQATDNLEEFLTYIVRLQEDHDGVLGKVDTSTEAGKRELVMKNLASLGSAILVVEWSEKRPDELAPALLKLLAAHRP